MRRRTGSDLLVRGLLFAGALFCAVVAGIRPLLQAESAENHAGWLVVSAMILCYLLTPLVRTVARRIGAIDRPGGRKIHEKPTPLLGGAAIYIAFTVAVLVSGVLTTEVQILLVTGSVIFSVGVLEDTKGVSALVRLVVQIAAVAVLVGAGIGITFLPSTWWGIPGEWLLTFLWIVGITNAFNFLDGLDGLATGSAVIHALFMGVYATTTGQTDLAVLSLCLMGASLGFLPHNFKPHRRGETADIFLGDSGSTFLGFMLASLAVMGDWAEEGCKDLIVPVLILAVPIFDMVLTTIVRVGNSTVRSFVEWIVYTGRDHFHHRLLGIGMRKEEAVAIIYLLNLCLGLSGFLLKESTTTHAFLVLGQVAIIFGVVGYALVVMDRRSRGGSRPPEPNPSVVPTAASVDRG